MNQLVVIHRMKTLFLRYDPGVNSEVSDRVLPRNMLLFKGVECPPVCCMGTFPHSLHGMAALLEMLVFPVSFLTYSIFGLVCFHLPFLYYCSCRAESGLDVCWDFCKHSGLVTHVQSSQRVVLPSTSNSRHGCSLAHFPNLSSTAELRQHTAEVSGTVVHCARKTDNLVQRGDGR